MVVVVVEEIEQDGALALGALWVILGEHHVHEAARATYENHRSGFRAVGVSQVVVVVLLV